MKKIIFTILILFLTTLTLQAQIYQSKVNSSTTPLGANATYTGSAEKVMNFNNVYPYNYVVVVIKSDSSGSGKIQSSLNGTTWVTNMPFTYTAPDTITNRFITPVVLPYVRVVYTNGSKAQNSFSLTTTFINSSFSVNSISDITIGNIGSITGPVALPTGASTSANQTTQITRADTLNARASRILNDLANGLIKADTANARLSRLLLIDYATATKQNELRDSLNSKFTQWFNKNWATTERQDSVKQKLINVLAALATLNDTTKASKQNLDAIKTAIQLIDNAVDGNYLNVNTNFAGADASVNTGNADATTQRVVLATDQPAVPISLTSADTVVVKNITNALPAGDNNIGNMDIVSLPSGNLGQQLSAASLSVTPATNIADATYIGDIKFGESLPSGTAIIGQFGIDQTTPGTTNKVSIGTDGTVTANAGTNLNTSLLALESGGNLATIAGKDFATQTTLALIKAKTDNIDNATSTLATTANQTNGTQRTKLTDGTNNVDVEAGAVKKALYVRLTDGTNVSSLSATGDLEVSGDGGVALSTSANQTNGTAKSQVVDGAGNVIGATSNALDINIKSGSITSITNPVAVTGTFYQATQPVSIASVPSHEVTNAGTFPVQSTSVGSSNNYSTSFTTAGTVIDSVSFGFTTKEYTFINDGTTTDTLYISSASNFPATNTSKIVGTEWITKRRASTKLYFKVGATPLASKKIRIEAQ